MGPPMGRALGDAENGRFYVIFAADLFGRFRAEEAIGFRESEGLKVTRPAHSESRAHVWVRS